MTLPDSMVRDSPSRETEEDLALTVTGPGGIARRGWMTEADILAATSPYQTQAVLNRALDLTEAMMLTMRSHQEVRKAVDALPMADKMDLHKRLVVLAVDGLAGRVLLTPSDPSDAETIARVDAAGLMLQDQIAAIPSRLV